MLHEIGHIGGHFFAVRNRGFGKPSVIEARSKDEDQFGVYEWNGHGFEEVAKRVKPPNVNVQIAVKKAVTRKVTKRNEKGYTS